MPDDNTSDWPEIASGERVITDLRAATRASIAGDGDRAISLMLATAEIDAHPDPGRVGAARIWAVLTMLPGMIAEQIQRSEQRCACEHGPHAHGVQIDVAVDANTPKRGVELLTAAVQSGLAGDPPACAAVADQLVADGAEQAAAWVMVEMLRLLTNLVRANAAAALTTVGRKK